jgi:hypothetical protein
MTPKGLQAWVRQAEPGDKISYFQGKWLNITDKGMAIGLAARAAYDAGLVHLYQTRETYGTPKDGGTFMWWMLRR